MTQYGFAIDLNRCQNTFACMGACKQHNQVELGTMWTRTFTVTTGDFENVQTYFIPIMCQHCRKPACLPACDKGAIVKREDGIVVVNGDLCADCEGAPCVAACPYGAISYSEQTKRAQKCTLCADLVDEGRLPYCADMCNSSAYTFGDVDDPDSAISQKIAAAGDEAYQLKPEAGTQPSVYYLLRNKTWHGMDNLRAR